MEKIEYNKKCNKYFITKLLDKYNIRFHSDNNFKFIILHFLENDENKFKNVIWATYAICCAYDITQNYILRGNDMIMIEKNIIDNKLIFDETKINNSNDLENQIKMQIFDHNYIGYIKSIKNNIIHYYLIKEIIRL